MAGEQLSSSCRMPITASTPNFKQFITGAVAAIALAASGLAANAATVVVQKGHKVFVERRAPIVKVAPRYIGRDRVIAIVRARKIRYVGMPYWYRGYYVLRCYDRFGRMAFCRIQPRTGAFLGISVRL